MFVAVNPPSGRDIVCLSNRDGDPLSNMHRRIVARESRVPSVNSLLDVAMTPFRLNVPREVRVEEMRASVAASLGGRRAA